MSTAPARASGVLLGIWQLARGRAEGFAQFGSSREGFLTSLAPLIAFPLVGAGLGLLRGHGGAALGDLLATLCALLAPPVLTHGFARAWRREAAWLRFATAFNWCQWAIPVVATGLLLVLGVLMALGLPDGVAGGMLLAGLIGYGLWLHWFLARHGLDLSGPRAALLVAAVNAGTALLVLTPTLIAAALDASGAEG